MVVQQEHQHSIPPIIEEPNIFINFGLTSSSKGNGGHTVEMCYPKHDYPPGQPQDPSHPCFNPYNGSVFVNMQFKRSTTMAPTLPLRGPPPMGLDFT